MTGMSNLNSMYRVDRRLLYKLLPGLRLFQPSVIPPHRIGYLYLSNLFRPIGHIGYDPFTPGFRSFLNTLTTAPIIHFSKYSVLYYIKHSDYSSLAILVTNTQSKMGWSED